MIRTIERTALSQEYAGKTQRYRLPQLLPEILATAENLNCGPLEFLRCNAGGGFNGTFASCYGNCLHFIDERQKRYRKRLAYCLGWMFWEYPGALIVAENHCVISTPGGLLDVTPQPDGNKKILFGAVAKTIHADEVDQMIPGNMGRTLFFPIADDARIAEFCRLAPLTQDVTSGAMRVNQELSNYCNRLIESFIPSRNQKFP